MSQKQKSNILADIGTRMNLLKPFTVPAVVCKFLLTLVLLGPYIYGFNKFQSEQNITEIDKNSL